MAKNKETITDKQRDTFVANEDFESRMLHMLSESKEVERIIKTIIGEHIDSGKFGDTIDQKIKESLKKSWLYIAIQSILLVSGVTGLIVIAINTVKYAT